MGGDEKGQVGVGIGKAEDVVNAFKKAKTDGRKNLIKVPITKSLSIPHSVISDSGACKIVMRPSIEGSGVIAGGAVRTVLEVAGIKNVIAKQLGSNNLLNNARATIVALRSLTTKSQVLEKRILLSAIILLFIRVGTFLPIPGINHEHLAYYIQQHPITKNLISTFSGNDTFVIGIFTLNIFPYINASILVQLITSLIPSISKLQKEGGSEGRRAITRLTRLITLGWALVQSSSVAFYLKQVLFDWTPFLAFEIILWLTTGAMIVLWLSELVSENIGNLTVVPCFGIVLLFFIAVSGIITLQESARIIPLISSKQLGQSKSFISKVKPNNYIPLRFNQAGVMPIILTTAIL